MSLRLRTVLSNDAVLAAAATTDPSAITTSENEAESGHLRMPRFFASGDDCLTLRSADYAQRLRSCLSSTDFLLRFLEKLASLPSDTNRNVLQEEHHSSNFPVRSENIERGKF